MEDGFIPIDAHCRIRGLEREFAAGDATDFSIKHGGIASQQADAAADAIAALAGAPVAPQPFRPVIHGVLLTGEQPRYLSAQITGGHGFSSEVSESGSRGRRRRRSRRSTSRRTSSSAIAQQDGPDPKWHRVGLGAAASSLVDQGQRRQEPGDLEQSVHLGRHRRTDRERAGRGVGRLQRGEDRLQPARVDELEHGEIEHDVIARLELLGEDRP